MDGARSHPGVRGCVAGWSHRRHRRLRRRTSSDTAPRAGGRPAERTPPLDARRRRGRRVTAGATDALALHDRPRGSLASLGQRSRRERPRGHEEARGQHVPLRPRLVEPGRGQAPTRDAAVGRGARGSRRGRDRRPGCRAARTRAGGGPGEQLVLAQHSTRVRSDVRPQPLEAIQRGAASPCAAAGAQVGTTRIHPASTMHPMSRAPRASCAGRADLERGDVMRVEDGPADRIRRAHASGMAKGRRHGLTGYRSSPCGASTSPGTATPTPTRSPSAIGYAELKRPARSAQRVRARPLGDLNAQTRWVLERSRRRRAGAARRT